MDHSSAESTERKGDEPVTNSVTKGSKPEEEEDNMKQMSRDKCKAANKCINVYKQCIGCCISYLGNVQVSGDCGEYFLL